jgi:hypothetical protein
MSLEAKAQEESMQSAFQDLEVLMVRAGEMVSATAPTMLHIHHIHWKGLSESWAGPIRAKSQRQAHRLSSIWDHTLNGRGDTDPHLPRPTRTARTGVDIGYGQVG